ncbi:MAG: DUF1287 domain-containing protein [Oscillospiraceae bacterium]
MKHNTNRHASLFKRGMIIAISLLSLILVCELLLTHLHTLFDDSPYTAADFGIETLKSPYDKDGDGIDDYRDLLLSARAYVNTRPKYKSTYESGGYPPEGMGVCTDVIWSAFQGAGYDLKALIDADIAAHLDAYPAIRTPDPNIDFRRVRNLDVFFRRHAEPIPTDLSNLSAWQPGDIVLYADHIAIVSDRRNKDGLPYIIHHAGQPIYEENALTRAPILAHYRWTPAAPS